MGSYTQGRLAFYFRRDTPDEVLASFSALAVTYPEAQLESQPPAPSLPEPVVEADDMWEPDYAEMFDGEPDPYAATPWQHDWASWVGGTLTWDSHRARWRLRCEFEWKTAAETMCDAIAWLSSFVDSPDGAQEPLLIGQVHDEHDPRPKLLWWHRGKFIREDLDPFRDSRPEALSLRIGELVVVGGLPGSGKSHLLTKLGEENPEWLICDDFYDRRVVDDSHPSGSRYFGAVVRALQKGRTVAIADVEFGHESALIWLLSEVKRQAPFTTLSPTVFELDTEACEYNIRESDVSDGTRNLQERLEDLRNWRAWIENRPAAPNRPVTRTEKTRDNGKSECDV